MTPEAFTENLIVDVLSRLEPAMRSLAEQVMPLMRGTLVSLVQQRFDLMQARVGTLEPSETYGRVMGMLLRDSLPSVRSQHAGPNPLHFRDFLVLRRRRHPLNADVKQYAVLMHAATPLSGLRITLAEEAGLSNVLPLVWHEAEEDAVLWFLSRYYKSIFWLRDAATWDEGTFYHYPHAWAENSFRLFVPLKGGLWLRTLRDDIQHQFSELPSPSDTEGVSRSLTWIKELLSISTSDGVYDAHVNLLEAYHELSLEASNAEFVQAWSRHHTELQRLDVAEIEGNKRDNVEVDGLEGFKTLYSGLGGEEIPLDQVREGMRVVANHEHGTVTQINIITWKRSRIVPTRDGITTTEPEEEKEIQLRVRLDDGRVSDPHQVFREVAPPRFVPAVLMFRGERLPPFKLWHQIQLDVGYFRKWPEAFARAERRRKAPMMFERDARIKLLSARVDLLKNFLDQNPLYGEQAISKPDAPFDAEIWRAAQSPLDLMEHESAKGEYQRTNQVIEGFTPSSFRVPGFGIVAVTAGDDRRNQMWYNISVGHNRFGWDGTRWSRGMMPPSEVLKEVRAKGYTMFPEEQSLSDWQPENPALHEHGSTDESVFDSPIQSGELACRSVPPMRAEQPCPDHTGPAHTCPCQRAGQQTPHPKRREQSLKTASGALPPDLSDLFPPLQDWGAYD